MRMHPDASPYLRILRIPIELLGQTYTAVSRVRTVAIADGKIGFDSGLFRTRKSLRAIGIVALAFEMGVGVDEHWGWFKLSSRTSHIRT